LTKIYVSSSSTPAAVIEFHEDRISADLVPDIIGMESDEAVVM